eukprot:4899910-Pleurochrysis_carterae.AAC.2
MTGASSDTLACADGPFEACRIAAAAPLKSPRRAACPSKTSTSGTGAQHFLFIIPGPLKLKKRRRNFLEVPVGLPE